jgi:CheY-like chemotaxis protein
MAAAPSVLVVDDEEPVGVMLDMMLKHFGCGVRVARTGNEAVAQLRSDDTIALVLLDVRMPGIDGPETLRLLRSIRPQVPCCYMTGSIGKYTESELRDGDVLDILWKPFHLNDIAAVLRRAGIQ